MKTKQNACQRIPWGKNSVILKIVIGALIAALVTVAGLQIYQYESGKELAFSSEAWDAQPSNRIRMVDSLMTQYHGLTHIKRDELVELLGANTYTSAADTYLIGHTSVSRPGIVMRFYFDDSELCEGYTISQGETMIRQYETKGWTGD